MTWTREKGYSKYKEIIRWLEWSIRELEAALSQKDKEIIELKCQRR